MEVQSQIQPSVYGISECRDAKFVRYASRESASYRRVVLRSPFSQQAGLAMLLPGLLTQCWKRMQHSSSLEVTLGLEQEEIGALTSAAATGHLPTVAVLAASWVEMLACLPSMAEAIPELLHSVVVPCLGSSSRAVPCLLVPAHYTDLLL